MNRTQTRQTRRCARCREFLPANAFGPNLRNRDGLHSYCRACVAAYNRAWFAGHPDVAERDRARKRIAPHALTCRECHKPFEAKRRDTLYCSDPCKVAARTARAIQRQLREVTA